MNFSEEELENRKGSMM